jgi:ribosome biogenesis GTPase
MDLTTLGWCPQFADALAALNRPDFVAGRVVSEDKHSVTVVGEDGDRMGIIPGRLLHRSSSHADLPKVGDWVAMSHVAGERKAVIEAVLPRRSKLARKVTGREAEEQVVAANLDLVFVVQALDPSFNVRRLERFLVMVHEGGARPVVLLNKADLCAEREALLEQAQAAAGNCPTLVMSAKTRKGLGPLRELLRPRETVCFVGTSGVGKSSLINRLYGEALQDTLEVREKDGKGRHTTTWREIIPLPNGTLVIDTPGMREFHLWHVEEGLRETFADISELGTGCHYRNCTHAHEADCAVKKAVAAGGLAAERYQSFLKLQKERTEVRTEETKHVRKVEKKRAHLSRLKHGYEDDDGEE